ncbi:DUF1549 domain-containing protein, partial [Enterococcus casseliflavus]|uniref:DUF1549 domain-containing protein n=1 Tax=Enterococcus casseliflavus TaxID=37734 RepID=UPI003D12237D
LEQPAVPQVKIAAAVRNPIDAFVVQELESRDIQPSPEADPRTLIKRVHLDLVGLLPTPEETEAFVKAYTANGADKNKVYEALV